MTGPPRDCGRQVVHFRCAACGRWGTVEDPETVATIVAHGRPRKVRCRRELGGCGAGLAPGEMILGWSAGATPFAPSAEPGDDR
jgi:hypothetical protein